MFACLFCVWSIRVACVTLWLAFQYCFAVGLDICSRLHFNFGWLFGLACLILGYCFILITFVIVLWFDTRFIKLFRVLLGWLCYWVVCFCIAVWWLLDYVDVLFWVYFVYLIVYVLLVWLLGCWLYCVFQVCVKWLWLLKVGLLCWVVCCCVWKLFFICV